MNIHNDIKSISYKREIHQLMPSLKSINVQSFSKIIHQNQLNHLIAIKVENLLNDAGKSQEIFFKIKASSSANELMKKNLELNVKNSNSNLTK